MGSREISNLSPPCSLLNFHQIFQKGAQNFVLLTPLQVYVSYDYGKSFKKISERFSFDGGNSSEVAIAQFYHSPADNKRVRGTWQLGLYPCCHREPGHPLGCPWGRGGTCQALLVRLGDARSVAGEGWLAQPNSSPPEFALPKAPLGCATFIAASLSSALTFPSPLSVPSTPSTSSWTPSPRTSGSPRTSATPSKASPFPSEQQTSSCTAGTPTSSWASTGLTLINR